MELVAGRSLRDLLRSRALTMNETIHYQAGILAALDFSHRAGVIHRDIKPANVIVTSTGAVKIVDFGIARAQGDTAATLTMAPMFLGTPSYLSPEQGRGEVAGASSDLYSAGCLLHELLTGQPPFVGDDPVSVVYQHVHEEPAPVDTGIPALDGVVAKALAKSPPDRFPDAATFRAALLAATRCALHLRPVALAHPVDEPSVTRAAGCGAGAAYAHR
jgi:serine/threonine-protein kinase